uniref:NADH dehydrogenase subunit 2 n=1 Tax=Neojurtina typica TaxID=2880911 RepID=UPI001D116090|nr:NADH dehydrogenase subunit 2 [Neojurtina typica]UCC46052.1 NADH dehydrogenase subunit 2 [Neojurtina typica]
MNKSKWLFLMTLIISTMITVSSNNWMSMWIGLELNMMSFIPLMYNQQKKLSSEACMIYFLTQSVSSMILIMMVSISMVSMFMKSVNLDMIITMSLLMKLGAAPFHLWMPEIMSKMEWSKCCILMTWQKIAPLMMMSNIQNNLMINTSIILSLLVGGIGGINQTSLRKMMGFSSINHLGWMLAINKLINSWLIYVITYSIMTSTICYMFSCYKMYFINQVNSMNMSNMEKVSYAIMMLSMGGLPPFIGFLPKWVTIQEMMNESEYFISLIMVMLTLITLSYYIKMMVSMFLMTSASLKWFKTINNKNFMVSMTISLNMSLPIMLMLDII